MYSSFATTARGLESLLIDELVVLGATETVAVNAGVQFKAGLDVLMRINLHSRLASRVMIQVGFGGYRNEQDIYNIARKIQWEQWFNMGNTIKISTSAIKSPVKSLEFITLKVKDAICDRFVELVDARPSVDKTNPDMRIYTFLTEDTATIYLDTSGEALFKRGYRQNKVEAPLKENLAAGLIKLSGWTPDQPFYDPMCGSGTIAIEAASIGINMAPGLERNFAFEKFVGFDSKRWNVLKEDAENAINRDIKLSIYASDISNRALDITQDNLSYAGLLDYVQISDGDFLQHKSPKPSGILITNPPYGVRLEEEDTMATCYPLWSTHLKQNYANWNCFFFSGDLRMPKLMRLKPERKVPLFNGALDCRLFEFKMVEGSNRKEKIV